MANIDNSDREHTRPSKTDKWLVCALIVATALSLYMSVRYITRKEKRDAPAILIRIDSIMQTDPKAAMKLLQTDGKPFETAPQQEQAYYKLLMASAADRMGQQTASDTDMMSVAKYYEKTQSYDKLARTYYIIGRINGRNGNKAKAMDFYIKAADRAEAKANYKTMAEARGQYMTLLFDGKMPNDSVAAYMNAYERNVMQLYSDRDKLQMDTRLQAVAIAVCAVIMVVLTASLLIAHREIKRKEAAHSANDATSTATMESHPICSEIRQKAQHADYKLPETSWDELFVEIDDLYDGLTSRLRERLPRITDVELMVCCLTRMGIRNSDIAHLLCRSDNAVSSIRSRLYEKISGEKGSSRLFNEFIQTF